MKNPKSLAESTTPAQLMRRLQSRLKAMQDVLDGLRGKPFSWGWGEAESYRIYIEKECGLTFVTMTEANRMGYVIKPRQQGKWVGIIYYGAPIARHCPVYVLEVQFDKLDSQAKAERKSCNPVIV
jgi:hypothetical protein